MKKPTILLSCFMALLLISCSGSDTYRGSWKAMDADGMKSEIVFDAKNFVVKDSAGKTKSYEYSQHSVEIKNSVKTYGIKLGDGRAYQVCFPKANNDSIGLIKDENGQPVFTMARHKFITYNEIYKLE